MDDRLQRILDGEYESVSTTAIVGPDGRLTVAIHVDYAEHPGVEEVAALKSTLSAHGWIEEGAWFDVLESIHTISVDHVPLPALLPIWRLDGVVTVEQQNVMIPFLDNSVPAMKVRDSNEYQDTMQALGYRGDDVVVAVLEVLLQAPGVVFRIGVTTSLATELIFFRCRMVVSPTPTQMILVTTEHLPNHHW